MHIVTFEFHRFQTNKLARLYYENNIKLNFWYVFQNFKNMRYVLYCNFSMGQKLWCLHKEKKSISCACLPIFIEFFKWKGDIRWIMVYLTDMRKYDRYNFEQFSICSSLNIYYMYWLCWVTNREPAK